MRTLIHLCMIFFCALGAQSQEMTITGTVTDGSDPLPGANVLVKGTETLTATDFDGHYEVTAKITDTLVFTFLGFERSEVVVKDQQVIDVILDYSGSALEEVVVVGYGRRGRKDVTASMSTISDKLLSGKTSGVSVGYEYEESDIVSSRENDPAYGQLTAGEINDLEKWSEFKEIYKNGEALDIAKKWQFDHTNKVKITVNNTDQTPAANVLITLYKNKEVVMKGLTDITGTLTLFKGGKKSNDTFLVQLSDNGNVKGKSIGRSQKSVAFIVENIKASNDIDVMFTVDATGSMGDEIAYLKSELKNIMNRIDTSIEQKRIALTFYRDHGDDYVTKHQGFSTNIDDAKTFITNQNADGGGDYEEAIEEALKVSLAQSWGSTAKTRLLFLVLDAPPHFTKENVLMIKKQIATAQQKGIKIIPVVSSGANKEVEFLMRSFSVATNGTYVFLTDDSGIGNDHIEATTKSFKVEKLNDLIVRLIEKYAGVNINA